MNRIAKTRFDKFIMLLLLLLFGTSVTQAQSTPFTYQGRLAQGSPAVPATGNFDLQFVLYDAGSGGAQVGPLLQRINVAVALSST